MPSDTGFKHPDVRLEVSGALYGGWTKISVRRALDQVAGTFDLEVTERWPGQESIRPIAQGAPCRVLVDGTPVITGYVDEVAASYDATSHAVAIRGRDKTADIVDCCPPSTQLPGGDIATVARKLCAPFGIKVVAQASGKSGASFKSNEGDTVFEMLEQLARAQAVLLTTDGAGNLVITRAGQGRAGAALELGQNILRCQASLSMRERFSDYTVRGQSAGSDLWGGESAAHPKGTARDPRVPRFRPLTVVAEQQAEGGNAGQRAQWEANVRYGKGQTITYTVAGWYAGQHLWTPNTLVQIRDAFVGLSDTWLITGVTWRMDQDGWLSELTVNPREAYDTTPLAPRRKKQKDDGDWNKGTD